MLKRVLRAAGWVFLGILLGRTLGFARELLIATSYGATGLGDAAVLLINIPDTLVTILIGGAMGAALIPEFARLPERHAWGLYRESRRAVALLFFPLAGILCLSSPWLVRLFAPGFSPALSHETARWVAIAVWAVPLAALAAIERAYLQSKHRFAVPSMATTVYNAALVAALLLPPRLFFLALATLAGGGVSLAMQALAARRHTPEPDLDEERPPRLLTRSLALRYGQAFLAGSLLLMLPAAARALASFQGPGQIALLNFAQKLLELPLGLALTVFSVALFPSFSGLFAQEKTRGEGVRIARSVLQVVFVLSIAILLPMLRFRVEIAQALFGYGQMTPEDARRIGALLGVLLAGLAAQAMLSIVTVTLNALRDMASGFWVTLLGTGLFLGVAATLRETHGTLGIAGCLAATYWAILLTLGAVLARRHEVRLLSALFDPSVAKALLFAVLGFAPFAALGAVLPLPPFAGLGLTVLSAGLSAALGALALPEIRARLSRKFRTPPRD